MTLKDKIKNITREHLKLGNPLFSQCITAVGWIGGTVPEDGENLIELPMADVMNPGIAVGSALIGKRPIYVVRYQGFQVFNSAILGYAAKSKEMWNIPCPIFIRSIAMEGGVGPVASSSYHSLFCRAPGFKVCSPMTPNEYQEVYKEFMSGDDPMYVSEHRGSYNNSEELPNIISNNPDFVLFPFSITRFEAAKVAKTIPNISVFHQLWINPLRVTQEAIESLMHSKYGGILLDDDYPNGVAKQIAYELMLKSGRIVYVLALKEKVAGFQKDSDNLPPTAKEIIEFMEKIKSE